MFTVPLATSLIVISNEKFWEAVTLYHNRPHIVNRKLVAVLPVLFYEIRFESPTITHVKELFTASAVLYESRRLKALTKDNITVEFITNIVQAYDKNVKLIESNLEDFANATTGVYISVRILLPKYANTPETIEVAVLDKDSTTAYFIAGNGAVAPPFSYEFQLTPDEFKLVVNSIEDADTTQAGWLADKLFPKLLKWTEDNLDTNKNTIQSLSLIATDDYYQTYTSLKGKYADKLVKEWPNQATTDPQKYVFEDLAIASYLICVWKKYCATSRVKFADCGCGNGLLVYVLNQEGFEGFGLDIRKRQTWEMYPKETKLLEETVDSSTRFADCTWLIGNHSDELTPWIPIIALKSSRYCNFFVLPCCPFDLDGRKFIRTNSRVSQYSDYLTYVEELCKLCGFDTKVDKLRIPSTKRTCFVGIRNNFKVDEIKLAIDGFIEERCIPNVNKFAVREKQEKVRNCTQVDPCILRRIVHGCIEKLLEVEDFIDTELGDKWNKGGAIKMDQLVQCIAKEDLVKIKNECGGFQTLLRNHRYLFDLSDGVVRIRQPFRLSDVTVKYKGKPCWFFKNHPDGCLFDSETCAYKH